MRDELRFWLRLLAWCSLALLWTCAWARRAHAADVPIVTSLPTSACDSAAEYNQVPPRVVMLVGTASSSDGHYVCESGGWVQRTGGTGGGGGEANTASCLGGGLCLYSTKVGVDLRFVSAASADFNLASNLLSIDDSTWAKDADVPPNARTLTAGAGIAGGGDLSANRSFATDSTETDFLAAGTRTCGAATQGQAGLQTSGGPLTYCDATVTPVLRRAAYGDSSGSATLASDLACTTCVDTTDLAANAATDAKVSDTLTIDMATSTLSGLTVSRCLRSNGSGAVVVSTTDCPPATEALLDGGVHSDTTAATVTRGAIMVGSSVPKWAKVAVGAAGTVVQSDGTDTTFGAISTSMLPAPFNEYSPDRPPSSGLNANASDEFVTSYNSGLVTWANQSTASATWDLGTLNVQYPASASSSKRVLWYAAPGAVDWVLSTKFTATGTNAAGASLWPSAGPFAGLAVLEDGTTGSPTHWDLCAVTRSATTTHDFIFRTTAAGNYTSAMTLVGADVTFTGNYSIVGQAWWLRIRYTSSTKALNCDVSTNGLDWFLNSGTRTAAVTPQYVGLAVDDSTTNAAAGFRFHYLRTCTSGACMTSPWPIGQLVFLDAPLVLPFTLRRLRRRLEERAIRRELERWAA